MSTSVSISSYIYIYICIYIYIYVYHLCIYGPETGPFDKDHPGDTALARSVSTRGERPSSKRSSLRRSTGIRIHKAQKSPAPRPFRIDTDIDRNVDIDIDTDMDIDIDRYRYGRTLRLKIAFGRNPGSKQPKGYMIGSLGPKTLRY